MFMDGRCKIFTGQMAFLSPPANTIKTPKTNMQLVNQQQKTNSFNGPQLQNNLGKLISDLHVVKKLDIVG